jgi:hypothetical protein
MCFVALLVMPIWMCTSLQLKMISHVLIVPNGSILRDRFKNYNESNVPLPEIPLDIIEKYKNHPYCQAYHKLLPVNGNHGYNAYLKKMPIRHKYNKKQGELITIYEFCEYTGLNEERVRQFLTSNN